MRSADDPNVVISLRPGTWDMYLRHYLRRIDEAEDWFGFSTDEIPDEVGRFYDAYGDPPFEGLESPDMDMAVVGPR